MFEAFESDNPESLCTAAQRFAHYVMYVSDVIGVINVLFYSTQAEGLL